MLGTVPRDVYEADEGSIIVAGTDPAETVSLDLGLPIVADLLVIEALGV